MGTAVLLAPGSRVWTVDGVTATITTIGDGKVWARIDGQPRPEPITVSRWRPALACEYCDRPADVQLVDGQPGDVLCHECAYDQFDRPADWVRPIPRAVIRALYDSCERLG